LENPLLERQRGEQLGEASDAFRAAEKEHAAGIQAVVKKREKFSSAIPGSDKSAGSGSTKYPAW
jgi:hypothetical protein